MRTHKCIKELKEKYNYQFDDISQDEVEEIVSNLLGHFKIDGIRTPIVDISNKLGFTVNHYSFDKIEVTLDNKRINAFFGVGIDFDTSENSNFFMIEKNLDNETKKFLIAYLLTHYIFKIKDDETDFYTYGCYSKDMHNDLMTRFALTLLMPKEKFLALQEFISMTYETSHKYIDEDILINQMAKIFFVSPEMIRFRKKMINKQLQLNKATQEQGFIQEEVVFPGYYV